MADRGRQRRSSVCTRLALLIRRQPAGQDLKKSVPAQIGRLCQQEMVILDRKGERLETAHFAAGWLARKGFVSTMRFAVKWKEL